VQLYNAIWASPGASIGFRCYESVRDEEASRPSPQPWYGSRRQFTPIIKSNKVSHCDRKMARRHTIRHVHAIMHSSGVSICAERLQGTSATLPPIRRTYRMQKSNDSGKYLTRTSPASTWEVHRDQSHCLSVSKRRLMGRPTQN